MALQSVRSPNFGSFGTLNLGVTGQNDIWMQPLWLIIENTIREKVMTSPSSGHGESCEFVYACDLSMHQKCSNYALTNLFGLCMFVWIIDPHFIHANPHLRALASLFTSEVVQVTNYTPIPFLLLSPLNLHLSFSRNVGVCHWIYYSHHVPLTYYCILIK